MSSRGKNVRKAIPVLRTPVKSPGKRNEPAPEEQEQEDEQEEPEPEEEEQENKQEEPEPEDAANQKGDMAKIIELIQGIKEDVKGLRCRLNEEVDTLSAGIVYAQEETHNLREVLQQQDKERFKEELREERTREKIQGSSKKKTSRSRREYDEYEELGGNEPEEEDVPPRRRESRRDSGYQRLGAELFKARENILVVESDKHLTIKWKIKNIDAYLRFLEEIEKFQLKYNQKVPYLFPHLEDNIQEWIAQQLMIEFPRKYNNRQAVYRVEVKDLTSVCQAMFCPNDTQHFLRLLQSSCNPYAVETEAVAMSILLIR
jgi:hypothetical protein